MLHEFFKGGDWFMPKRHGYGAGLPIAWQGWVITALFVGLVVGTGLLVRPEEHHAPLFIALVIAESLVFSLIVRRRTRGGWRWRWGDSD